jgi:hypothetical protein
VATYGAVGDGVADDTTAIQNTINAAAAAGKSAYLPGGNYLITSRLNLGSTTLTGEGVTVEGGMQRSLLVAGTQGMTMLYCTAKSRVDNIGLQGDNLANIGIKAASVRVSLSNIEVYRCRKTSYLLASTQNSTFTNCYSTYSTTAFTLANGARNNNFYNCTSNNSSQYYDATAMGVPWSETKLIYYVIDTSDPDYGTTVTQNGNDRNNWFGGIHERCGLGIKFENRSGYTDSEAVNNQFYGVEFSCTRTLDTSASLRPGTLLLDSCCFILEGQSTPFSTGTKGFAHFQGECYFSGANDLNNRGISINSNYASLFVIDTDSTFSVSSSGGASITPDETTKSVTINGGGASTGAMFQPHQRGNVSNSATSAKVGRPAGFNAILTYTITQITGTNPVLVMISQDAAPWRRTVASPTQPGTYSVPVRIGEAPQDTFRVMVSANGNSSCTVKGVSMRAAGHQ